MTKTTKNKFNDLLTYPFLVKTLITYTKLNAQGNETKFKDEIIFKLDKTSVQMPWYVLRNYSVPKYLTATYGPFEVAWQRIYEIRIIKIINRKNPEDIIDIPLRVMTQYQLRLYCNKWELNVPVEEFYSVGKAREMVALRELDEKGYIKHLAEYREGKQRSYPQLDKLRGDAVVATTTVDEFDTLDTISPKVSTVKPKKKKSISAVEIQSSELTVDEKKELLVEPSTVSEDTDAQIVTNDPFAGV